MGEPAAIVNEEAYDKLKLACRAARAAALLGKKLARTGATLFSIATTIEDYIRTHGAEPAFPVNLGVNSVAAHYTPPSLSANTQDTTYRLQKGDLLKIDVGAHVDGYIGDTAITVEVGSNNYREMILCVEEALHAAIDVLQPGVAVSTIGKTIESVILSFSYRPVANLGGHGLGRYTIHTGLSVPNINTNSSAKIPENALIAIEPFATTGRGYVVDGQKGNIYRNLKRCKLDKNCAKLWSRFKTLPYAERWCKSMFDEHKKVLDRLVRQKKAMCYPVLVEATKGLVSQAEHTVLVAQGSVEVLTSA